MYSVLPADAVESRELLCRLWSSHLPVRGGADEKLRWFYCDNPHGAGRAFLLKARDTPVGCAGLGVRRLHHHGRPFRAALFADLAVDPSHRSGLPAVTLLRSVHADVKEHFDLGYGFPNHKAIAVYRRAGYRELGKMYRYVRVLRSQKYLADRLGRLARPVAAVVDRGLAAFADAHAVLARGHRLVWLGEFDQRFDRLWEATRGSYPVACERTAAFLRWRFAHEPHQIVGLEVRRTGVLVGYAVIRAGDDGLAELLDLFAAGGCELGALLALIVPELTSLGYAAAGFRFLGNPRVVRLLQLHGFVRRDPPRSVMVVSGRGALALRVRELESWYLTDLDEDS
jgi:hypothetical protein